MSETTLTWGDRDEGGQPVVIQYHDRTARRWATLVLSAWVTTYGGNSRFIALLLHPGFYLELFVTFLFAIAVVEWVSWITRKLDVRYDWNKAPWKRLLWQVLCGIIVPGLAVFLMAAAYFGAMGDNILDTTYPEYGMPLIMLLIIFYNGYYYVYYKHIMEKRAAGRLEGLLRREKPVSKEAVITIPYGSSSIDLAFVTIALVYHDKSSKTNYLLTFDGQKYPVPYIQDQIMGMLDKGLFFPISRTIITNFHAITGTKPAPFGKEEVFFDPQPPLEKPPYTVSQNKRSQFLAWMGDRRNGTDC